MYACIYCPLFIIIDGRGESLPPEVLHNSSRYSLVGIALCCAKHHTYIKYILTYALQMLCIYVVEVSLVPNLSD